MPSKPPTYGPVASVEELGRVARAHRKQRQLTLETVSGLGHLSARFLSEFERGKETAEVGKVLKALKLLGLEIVVRPRGSGGSGPWTGWAPWTPSGEEEYGPCPALQRVAGVVRSQCRRQARQVSVRRISRPG
jgi:transcriptional regulator with XRE-family HTH domain